MFSTAGLLPKCVAVCKHRRANTVNQGCQVHLKKRTKDIKLAENISWKGESTFSQPLYTKQEHFWCTDFTHFPSPNLYNKLLELKWWCILQTYCSHLYFAFVCGIFKGTSSPFPEPNALLLFFKYGPCMCAATNPDNDPFKSCLELFLHPCVTRGSNTICLIFSFLRGLPRDDWGRFWIKLLLLCHNIFKFTLQFMIYGLGYQRIAANSLCILVEHRWHRKWLFAT